MEQSRFMTIAHGLAVVEFMSDRVGVMYLGRLAEIANADQLYGRPPHPYTKALMRAAMATDLPRGGHEAYRFRARFHPPSTHRRAVAFARAAPTPSHVAPR